MGKNITLLCMIPCKKYCHNMLRGLIFRVDGENMGGSSKILCIIKHFLDIPLTFPMKM